MFGKRSSRSTVPSARERARATLSRADPDSAPAIEDEAQPAADSPPDADVPPPSPEPPPPPEPPPAEAAEPLYRLDTLGEALKAARLDQSLSLQDVADQTRVRRAYLEAIEDMRLDALPSRPFTIGYIRAYASALGLDPELAIERFKADEPVLDEPLHAPVGMLEERDPRVAAFLIGALIIIAAIVLWNVAQRAMTADVPQSSLPSEAATAKALAGMKSGVVELGYPLPAPVESTTPAPYETPGLAAAMGLKIDPGAATAPRPTSETSSVDLASLPPTFQPQGKIYDAGNPQAVSVVILQALKPASLIIRGANGSVYFARQLSPGEAFRVPQLPGLTLDVSKADDFQVFVSGRSRGVLPAQQVLASKLATPPPEAAPAPAAPQPPPT